MLNNPDLTKLGAHQWSRLIFQSARKAGLVSVITVTSSYLEFKVIQQYQIEPVFDIEVDLSDTSQ